METLHTRSPETMTAILVIGFIRSIKTKYNKDVNLLCIKYHGKFYSTLFQFSQESVAQYIDDRYVIAFHKKRREFLCTNIETGDIHLIYLKKGHEIDENAFSLAISDPLEASGRGLYKSSSSKFDIGKIADPNPAFWICKPCTFINHGWTERCEVSRSLKSFDYYHWTDFYHRIWNLFIRNRLYDESKMIADESQQIWKLIQFVCVVYCSYGKKNIVIPTMILKGDEQTIQQQFEKFNVDIDCKPKILEFNSGESLKCKCFMFGYWGRNAELRQVTFSIRQIDKEIELCLDIKTITSIKEKLPDGWEKAYTADGIAFYINHMAQTTQWEKPNSISNDV